MKRRFDRSVLATAAMTLTVLSFSTLSSSLKAQTRYTLTDLGFLQGGTGSSARDINNDGIITGSSQSTLGDQAFIWDPINGMRGLGFLPDTTSSSGWAINIHQQIAGSASGDQGRRKGFIWDAVNGMQDIGKLDPTDVSVNVNGLNDAGQVVGSAQIAFIWDSVNGMSGIPSTLGGTYSTALDVNASGQVVGQAGTSVASRRHAFIWDEVAGMHDLGTLPDGNQSAATALNNFGVVTGGAFTPTNSVHAYRWDSVNGMQDLGSLNPKIFGGYSSSYDIILPACETLRVN